MYHLPIKRGFEFEVHTLRNRMQALKTSCKPYTAKGNVSFAKSINLSCPSAECVWFGPLKLENIFRYNLLKYHFI